MGNWRNWWGALGAGGRAGAPREVSPSRKETSVRLSMMGLEDTVRQRTAVVGGEREKTSETHPWVAQVGPNSSGDGGTGTPRPPTCVLLAVTLGGLRLAQLVHQIRHDLLQVLRRVAALRHGEEDLVVHHDAARTLERGHGWG